MDEFVNGQWRDPSVLPPHLRKLHGRIQRARHEERVTPQIEDDEGRGWGPKSLRRASRRRNTTTGRST